MHLYPKYKNSIVKWLMEAPEYSKVRQLRAVSEMGVRNDDKHFRDNYEISFTRYFYKPQPMRTLEEIRADILALEQESGGLEAIIGRGELNMNLLEKIKND